MFMQEWGPVIMAFLIGLITFFKYYFKGPVCPCRSSIKNKVVIVTGTTSGIGMEAALEFARRGATVILASRSENKGLRILDFIQSESNNRKVFFLKLDLLSQDSVWEFVAKFKERFSKLDILVNNAAVMLAPRRLSKDGFETHLATNYLGPFLLIHLLMDSLKKSSQGRIINVSALAHSFGKIKWHDINLEVNYNGRQAYSQSKLALNMMSTYLSYKLKGTSITVNCMHPGIVRDTELIRHTPLASKYLYWALFPLLWYFLKTPHQAMQTIIYMAVSPDLSEVTGKYFADCKEVPPSVESVDMKNCTKLYWFTVNLLNLSDNLTIT